MENPDIKGQVLTPASGEAYLAALRRISDLSSLPAQYIVQPAVYSDIPPIIAFATSQNPPLELAVKGGGAHSATWASSDGGVVIDLSKLNKVTVAADKQTIFIQGGAHWGDVYEVCAKEHVDVVGGSLWFVGVGGFTLGGGYSPLSGEHGLTIDNLLEATVVLADGRIVKASATEEPDLFWALRGGGGQFGVVVEFVFKAFPRAGPYTSGIMAYSGTEINNILNVIQNWKETQTYQEKLTIQFSRPGPRFKPSVVIMPWVSHDKDCERSKIVLSPFLSESMKPVFQKIATVQDMLTVSHAADAAFAVAPRRLIIRGTILSDIFPELLLSVWEKWAEFTEANEDVRGSAILWDITSPTKMTEVAEGATALKTRVPHYWMAMQGRSTTDASVASIKAFTSSLVTHVREKNAELSGKDLGWFLSLAQGEEYPEDVYGKCLPRLRQVKAKYDPKQVWKKGVTIEPDFSD